MRISDWSSDVCSSDLANLARFDTSGIDVALNYRFRLDDALGIPGRFDLRYDGTHILKQKVSFEGIDGTVTNDLRGDLRDGSFKYRAQGSLGWKLDNFRIRWTTTDRQSTRLNSSQ